MNSIFTKNKISGFIIKNNAYFAKKTIFENAVPNKERF
jgi:hypothetical protein